nr:MAG TPA: hypothetical protein [Caudoviricetes sp.]
MLFYYNNTVLSDCQRFNRIYNCLLVYFTDLSYNIR